MKKLYVLLVIVIFYSRVLAQTNTFPASGGVGIGTISPLASLDIYKSYDSNQNKALKMFYDGSWGYVAYANAFRFIDIESTEGGKVLQVNGYGVGMGFDPPGISSADKLYVNGNVGIGTNTPSHKLSIKENSNQNTYLTIGNNSIGMLYGVGGTILGIAGTSSNTDFALYTNLTERMRITATGDIGIGTSDSHGYKLAVNGKIRAQEIKVETANWPDYVFAKSYQLPTLQQTEKHIKEKGHLPGIPSGAEVKANGIDLGEMNAKLLQKIEELTLQVIELSKQNKTQNEAQQKEINYLKSKLK